MIKNIVERSADNIRMLSAAMVEQARSGHPGGAMGGADFIQILYSEFLRFDPNDRHWINRDRFFLDPGHMSPMLYATLALLGFFAMDDLRQFRQWGSHTPGHPELDLVHGIENTSGPLGQGHVMAVGAAIAERFLAHRFGDWMEHRIYTFISDGGVQEEISQGAGRIAGFLGLKNLVMFFDSNDVQLSTSTSDVTNENTAQKYRSWGWNVITINGNDAAGIRKALTEAGQEANRPTLIIGKTIMGKGALDPDGNPFEGQCATHGQPLSKTGASFEKTILNLGGDPSDPFQVFPDVTEYYKGILMAKAAHAQVRKREQLQWESSNPEGAQQLLDFFSGKVSPVDFRAIDPGKDKATRMASGKVLEHLGEVIGNMIVMSADLSNSDKTEGFLKHRKPFSFHDFSGAFLHTGVSELTMAALANGIALHGGVHVACGTFFVFSDYMKPAVRMAALMELPVIYIWTHDSFRVGEDGPTHQPVEHEAQIRLLEELKNHSGKNSLLVMRPADGIETVVAWKMALENRNTPTALILTRQAVKDIPASNDFSRYNDALQSSRGAYKVFGTTSRPDIILVASGSEVSTLCEVARMLEEKNVHPHVVSAISEGLFRKQPLSYQREIIPENVPVFGLTAGIPATLKGFAGHKGMIQGIDHFGYSAPAEVLDRELGFIPEQILKSVLSYLSSAD
jgi:transketolase